MFLIIYYNSDFRAVREPVTVPVDSVLMVTLPLRLAETVMSNQMLKHVLSGPSVMSTSPNPPGRDLKLFQPKKNTVLVSHGRPPWYVIPLCAYPLAH